MKELILELVTAYEDRILMVQEWITTAYQSVLDYEGGLGTLDEERERLKTGLQEILAKNCSLRRKDFTHVMQGVLADSERKRREIEEEQKQVIEKIKGHLGEQKALAISLRQQLAELVPEKADSGTLNTVISSIRTTYQDTGQQLFAQLRGFQLHLSTCQREQEDINQKLKRLVDRGEFLRIEDLRQLEATKAREDRKAERDLRREEVERLLRHFKQHRESHHSRQR